jgi:hypothetical protein
MKKGLAYRMIYRRPNKIALLRNDNDDIKYYWFWCPGCKELHSVQVGKCSPSWTFSGTRDNPTIRASVLVSPNKKEHRCHLFVTDGKIQYLSDSHHELAGKTIEMEEIHHHL